MVEIPVSEITLKTIDGQDLVIKYKSVLTAYDSDLIKNAILLIGTPNESEKRNYNVVDLRKRHFEIMVKEWSLKDLKSLDDIKQCVSNDEFDKLYKAIDAVIEPKKK